MALNDNGATVVGKVELKTEVHASLPSDMDGFYDCIFLLTKQLENQKVAAFLKPFLAENGMLCTMQNCLPEPLLMEILGNDRVCGCAVGWGATLLGPGVVELTSEADALHFNLGLPTAGREERLGEIAEILGHMGPVTIEQNFIGAATPSSESMQLQRNGNVLEHVEGLLRKEPAHRPLVMRSV